MRKFELADLNDNSFTLNGVPKSKVYELRPGSNKRRVTMINIYDNSDVPFRNELVENVTIEGVEFDFAIEAINAFEDLKKKVAEGGDLYGNEKNNLQNWQFDTNDRLHVAVIGDSISVGAWSDVSGINWMTKGFAGMMRKSLIRIYGDGGMGFIGLFNSTYWTKVGSWGINADFAPFGYCYTATSNALTFTLNNVIGDNAEIYYVNNSAVTFSYSIDGGADVPVVSTGPYTNQIAKVSISLGSLGTHSLKITGATSGTLFFQGASIYTGNKGIVIHRIALSGEVARNVSTKFSTRFSPMIQHFSPKLTFLNFLANDFIYQDNVNNSVSNYTTNMNTIASAIKALGSDLIIWQPPKGTKLPNANTYTLKQYEDASKNTAINNNATWVDFHADWGDSNLDKMYDDQHPNEKGHKYIASQFLRILRLFT